MIIIYSAFNYYIVFFVIFKVHNKGSLEKLEKSKKLIEGILLSKSH